MHIGYTGPISLQMLAERLPSCRLPAGYLYPFGANLVSEYLNCGHTVTVFTLDSQIKAPMVFNSDRLNIHVGPMRKPAILRVPDGFRKELIFLQNAIRTEACDVMHAQWTYEFALAALKAHPRVLVTARDAPGTIVRHMPEVFRIARYLIARRVSKKATVMSAVSPYIANYYRMKMGYSGAISVIPNALSSHMVSLTPKVYVQNGESVVFCNTSWSRLKNPKAAIRGFALAAKQCDNVRLKICGNGLGNGDKGQRWAKVNGLSDRVDFLGRIDFTALQQLLKNEVHIYLHPSREESFSMAIAEAMSKGIPCIGGNASGAVPWLLDAGHAGLLVDITSAPAIADAILRLTENAKLYNQLATSALNRVRNELLLKDVVEQYLNEMRRLMQK